MKSTLPFSRRDLLLVILILAAAAVLWIRNRPAAGRPAAFAEISIDGETIRTLDLDENTELTIENPDGGFNHLIVENGQVFIDEASCPDKICIRQGRISAPGEMIVCLPNKVIVKIPATE